MCSGVCGVCNMYVVWVICVVCDVIHACVVCDGGCVVIWMVCDICYGVDDCVRNVWYAVCSGVGDVCGCVLFLRTCFPVCL